MSLRSLLPIGRAFGSAADRPGRYRRAEETMLPVFGGPPSGGAGRLEGGTREGAVGSSSQATLVGAGSDERSSVGLGRPSGRPVRKGGRRLPVWLEQLLLVLFRPGNRRRSTRPVQTEMCFEAVKVARNDLATADVEVVVVSPKRDRDRLSPACRGRLVRLWWREGARRLRQLSNTLF